MGHYQPVQAVTRDSELAFSDLLLDLFSRVDYLLLIVTGRSICPPRRDSQLWL
jgi:hypothetical protein